MKFDPYSSYGRWVIHRAHEDDADRDTELRLEEERQARAYCPELPPGPVYRSSEPAFEDDPELHLEAERAFGHWPHDVADVDAAFAEAHRRLNR